MHNAEQVINTPPEELLIEIGKQMATNRMFDGELGAFISKTATREQIREMIEDLWNRDDQTAVRQRFMYTRDAKTAIETIASYLKRKS